MTPDLHTIPQMLGQVKMLRHPDGTLQPLKPGIAVPALDFNLPKCRMRWGHGQGEEDDVGTGQVTGGASPES